MSRHFRGDVEIEPVVFCHEGGGPHHSCDACFAVKDRNGDFHHAERCGAALVKAVISTSSSEYSIAYDCDLRRPGCVILQAALGTTLPSKLFHDFFPASSWLVARTPGMKIYKVSEAMLPKLAASTDLNGDDS